MKFQNNQRVVFNGDNGRPWIKGRTGTVVRLLRRDVHEAWVNMDGDIPDNVRFFPADDVDGRGNHILAYDHECEVVK